MSSTKALLLRLRKNALALSGLSHEQQTRNLGLMGQGAKNVERAGTWGALNISYCTETAYCCHCKSYFVPDSKVKLSPPVGEEAQARKIQLLAVRENVH